MPRDQIKTMRAEIKRLQWSVARLTETNEIMSLKMKQQEDALTTRRIEVATLHQACAKHKRTIRIVSAQQLGHLSTKTVNSQSSTQAVIDDVCMTSQEDTNTEQRTLVDLSTSNKHISPPVVYESKDGVCLRCRSRESAMPEILERNEKISKLVDDGLESSKRFRKYLEEEKERSRKAFEEEKERSSTKFAKEMAEADESFQRDRRELAALPQRLAQDMERQLLVHRRRRNGNADAA